MAPCLGCDTFSDSMFKLNMGRAGGIKRLQINPLLGLKALVCQQTGCGLPSCRLAGRTGASVLSRSLLNTQHLAHTGPGSPTVTDNNHP